MRVDGMGKPPLISKKLAQVGPADKTPGSGTSTTSDREPKLGAIIDLIERTKKRKKPASGKEVSEAIKKYRLMQAIAEPEADPEKQVGQTLDRIV